MNEEDEAFNDIERQAKQRKEAVKAAMRRAEDDDDIQVYQRPWVGLTDEEFHDLQIENIDDPWANFKAIEIRDGWREDNWFGISNLEGSRDFTAYSICNH